MQTRRSFLSTLLMSFSAIPIVPQAQTSPEGADISTSGLGIILVAASWCPWCHGAAKELHLATQQWGWPVLIAALDNKPIPPFEHFFASQDHSLTAGIDRLPTTLIVDPKADHIVSAFEGFTGPVPYLTRIANTIDAYVKETAHG